MATATLTVKPPFPVEEYSVGAVGLSIAEMTLLLGVHPGFDLLRNVDANDALLMPEKQMMFWDLLGLWVELARPGHTAEYVQSLREAAIAYYELADAASQLDPFREYLPPNTLVAQTLARFSDRLPQRLADPRGLAIAISKQADSFIQRLGRQELMMDPPSFKARIAGTVLLLTSLGLSRGSYFQLTQKGEYVRTEIVTGLISYRSEKGTFHPKDPIETKKKVEWNVPEKVVEVLDRAVGTRETTARTLIDPKGVAPAK